MGLLLTTHNISLREEAAAFLTSAVVAKSYEVETTTNIVSLWKELQRVVPIDSDLDFTAAILATGRIMDLKEELKDPDGVAHMIASLKAAIQSSSIKEKDGTKAIICAFLASAYITETKEVETTSKTVEVMKEISEEIDIQSDSDIIPALLTVGRISELKKPVDDIQEIGEIFSTLRESVNQEIKKRDIRVRNREIVTAFMASALVGISPKVERIKDVVNTWLQVRESLDVFEDEDIVSVILATGRIKDLDAMHIVRAVALKDLVAKLRTNILKSG